MKKSWVQEKANVVLSSPFEAANMMLVRKKTPKNKKPTTVWQALSEEFKKNHL